MLAIDHPIDLDGDLAAKKKARKEELLSSMSEFDKEVLGLNK